MSLNYNEPDTAASVSAALDANPSITPQTNAAINEVLGLSDPSKSVVVGSWTGTGPVVQPTGTQTQMVVVDIDQAAGTTVDLFIPPLNLASTSVWIFDTDANINVTFNTVERVIVMGNGDDDVNVLGDRNTTIDGSAGNDVLTLTGGDDSITGRHRQRLSYSCRRSGHHRLWSKALTLLTEAWALMCWSLKATSMTGP